MKCNPEITGERIAELRAKQGLKQVELAKKLNVSRQIISYYETGKRLPNTEDIANLAEILNTTTDYLIGLTSVASTDINLKAVCDYTGLNETAIDSLNAYKQFSDYFSDNKASTNYDLEVLNFLNFMLSYDEIGSNVFEKIAFYKSDIDFQIKLMLLAAEREIMKLKQSLADKKDLNLSEKWDEYYSSSKELRDIERDCKINYLEAVEAFEKVVSGFVNKEKTQFDLSVKRCKEALDYVYRTLMIEDMKAEENDSAESEED